MDASEWLDRCSDDPRLLDVMPMHNALRAVLDLHPMSPIQRWVGFPRADRQEHYCMADHQSWPCPTVRAVTKELGVEVELDASEERARRQRAVFEVMDLEDELEAQERRHQ